MHTAESVSPRHPDKLCDQISDSILDAVLTKDPLARVAVEAVGGHQLLLLMGEITSVAAVDYVAVARHFVGNNFKIISRIVKQSPAIYRAVNTGGAGDQGIMIGYATNETANLIPLEVELSRSLNRYIFEKYPADGKTQITIRGNKITSVVASWQNVNQSILKDLIQDWLNQQPVCRKIRILANPGGDWRQGGFAADTGLTGRKIVIDNYGPRIPVGGGSFSGKDPTKVDRSAAYMARKIAVGYLKQRQAKATYCQLAYAIGVAQPVEATILIDGRREAIKGYDLSPQGIIESLNLKQPQYEPTARYGHFGNSFNWDH